MKVFHEPGKNIPVFSETDVLVVGGGPSGTAAAVSAGRLGVDVTLIERYNHLGGLSTGGLVVWIDRMTDWKGNRVISGFAKDVFDNMPPDSVRGPSFSEWGSKDQKKVAYWSERMAAFKDTVTFSPLIDPESLKTLSMKMILEQNVHLLFHSWVVGSIVKNDKVIGVIFESKEGRQVILSKIVIDTTGDADIFSFSGSTFESDIDDGDIHHRMNTAFLVGNVDMGAWLDFKRNSISDFKEFMEHGRKHLSLLELPECSWRNDTALFLGPRLAGYNGLNIRDLTEVDIRSREHAVELIDYYRRYAPGFENGYLLLCAPQTGVRHTRRIKGQMQITRSQWDTGKIFDDEIGVSVSVSPKYPNLSIPYRSLLPDRLKGLIGAGRHICCDAHSHTFMREIPQCWVTGQGAGVAAGLSVHTGKDLGEINIRVMQKELMHQGVYLSPSLADDSK